MWRTLTTLAVIFLLTGCNNPPYDGEQQETQANSSGTLKNIYFKEDNKTVHGVVTGQNCNPAILFIHGAPGDWRAWGQYMGDAELREKTFMFAIDRPGYGGSDHGLAETSLKNQGDMIMKAALDIHDGPFLLVGHSYGGPIQVQMAIDYQDKLSGNILLAGAIDPKLHKPRWYHYLASYPPTSWVLSDAMNITTKEMMALENGLKAQANALKDISVKTTVIQGSKDWLVPPGNATFAKAAMVNADVDLIELDGQGHFIPWQRYDLVKKTILEYLENAKGCEE